MLIFFRLLTRNTSCSICLSYLVTDEAGPVRPLTGCNLPSFCLGAIAVIAFAGGILLLLINVVEHLLLCRRRL